MEVAFTYLGTFTLGLLLALLITPFIIRIANYFSITALSWQPRGAKRHHVPLLGGISIFFSFLIGSVLLLVFYLDLETIALKHLIGFFIGGFVLVIGGVLDDKYDLPPRKQLIWPILAIASVIISGIGISYFTNPFSPEKLVYVDTLQYHILTLGDVPYRFTFPADIITFVWLGIIMYSTKLQDGLDGLVSGISFIGALFIFLLSFFVFNDITLSFLSVLFAGVLFGFLKHNIFPAKIFLGESGSLLTGFMLGVLALLSDAKVIITLILLAIPFSDALWTVTRRLYKRRAFWKGDYDHLHHRLRKAGYSPRQAVGLLYGITLGFGVLVLLWQSTFTYYFYGVAILAFLTIFSLFYYTYNKSRVK